MRKQIGEIFEEDEMKMRGRIRVGWGEGKDINYPNIFPRKQEEGFFKPAIISDLP